MSHDYAGKRLLSSLFLNYVYLLQLRICPKYTQGHIPSTRPKQRVARRVSRLNISEKLEMLERAHASQSMATLWNSKEETQNHGRTSLWEADFKKSS